MASEALDTLIAAAQPQNSPHWGANRAPRKKPIIKPLAKIGAVKPSLWQTRGSVSATPAQKNTRVRHDPWYAQSHFEPTKAAVPRSRGTAAERMCHQGFCVNERPAPLADAVGPGIAEAKVRMVAEPSTTSRRSDADRERDHYPIHDYAF